MAQDREIASKAVALVIKSARNGVVGICTEVACLLVHIQRLEEKLKENAEESCNGVEAKTSLVKTKLTEKEMRKAKRKKKNLFKLQIPQIVITADVHNSNNDQDLSFNDEKCHQTLNVNENQEVPKIHNEPLNLDADEPKLNCKEIGIQCNLINPAINRYEQEIRSLKRTINQLKMQIENSTELDHETRGNYNEKMLSLKDVLKEAAAKSPNKSLVDTDLAVDEMPEVPITVQKPPPILGASPLFGCICNNCLPLFKQKDVRVYRILSRGHPLLNNGDVVLTYGNDAGIVRYVGHLDDIKTPAQVFVGLELEHPVGKHNGTVGGKQYFKCSRNYGIILPPNEIRCVLQRVCPLN